MHKAILTLAATAVALTASPAFADEAMDVENMIEHSQPVAVNAITPTVAGFDIASIGNQQTHSFMATASNKFSPGYRLSNPEAKFERDSTAGLAALFVPEEFAYRSSAQDTGVDSALPGRYLSNSTRSDFLSESGPATRDKSSLGIRLGF